MRSTLHKPLYQHHQLSFVELPTRYVTIWQVKEIQRYIKYSRCLKKFVLFIIFNVNNARKFHLYTTFKFTKCTYLYPLFHLTTSISLQGSCRTGKTILFDRWHEPQQDKITGHFQMTAFWKISGKLIRNPKTLETQDKLGAFLGKKIQCSR